MTGSVVAIHPELEELDAVCRLPSAAQPAAPTSGVRSVNRALGLLRVMAAPRRSEWSLDELSRVTGLPKATTHRLLNTLAESGFVEHARSPGVYRLGLETAVIGGACMQQRRPAEGVRRILKDVSLRVQETVAIGLLSGTDTVSIAKMTPGGAQESALAPRGVLPAHASGGGKALLGGLSREQAHQLYGDQPVLARFTPKTITTVERLLDHLDQVRQQGFAIEDEEYASGVRCVGVAIPSSSGPPRYSIGMTAPASRADLPRLRIAVDMLEAAASKLSPFLSRPAA
ncbi:MAG: IclR family transcriptional regulator [Thermoleophilaceae bacterium]